MSIPMNAHVFYLLSLNYSNKRSPRMLLSRSDIAAAYQDLKTKILNNMDYL